MEAYLRKQFEELRDHAEAQNLRSASVQAAANPAPSNLQIRCTKPLDDQIAELMRTLPPQLRDRPWSMAELIKRLHGKYRDHPHGQQVGQALLRLGWRKERRWEKGYDGARLWLPS